MMDEKKLVGVQESSIAEVHAACWERNQAARRNLRRRGCSRLGSESDSGVLGPA